MKKGVSDQCSSTGCTRSLKLRNQRLKPVRALHEVLDALSALEYLLDRVGHHGAHLLEAAVHAT